MSEEEEPKNVDKPNKKEVTIRIGIHPKLENKKRKPVKWSADEESALHKGVRKFGKHAWQKIYEEFEDVFHEDRRPRDLWEKYRICEKKTSYNRTNKSVFYEVDEENSPVKDENGNVQEFRYKFPYDAAVAIARKKNIRSEIVVIRIEGVVLNAKCFHIYQAYRDSLTNKIKVYKIAGRSLVRHDGID